MTKVDKLTVHIFTKCTITCSKCNHQDTLMGETVECAEAWEVEGWYATKQNVYCPTCDEKRATRMAKTIIEGEEKIIKALADKGWKDAIAYYGPETSVSKKQIWTAEFEINHSHHTVFDKHLVVSKMHFDGGEYNGDGVIYANTIDVALEIISKLPNYK